MGRLEEWKNGRVDDWMIGRLDDWKSGTSIRPRLRRGLLGDRESGRVEVSSFQK